MILDRRQRIWTTVVSISALVVAAGCGGGSSSSASSASSSESPPASDSTPASQTVATAGLWKGTLTDPAGTSSELLGFVGEDGDSVWMTSDGLVFDGVMPMDGAGDTLQIRLHTYEQDQLRDPANYDDVTMTIEDRTRTHLDGEFATSAGMETLRAEMHAGSDDSASLESVAGVYTRMLSSGYTMTMAITSRGELTASDTLGCQLNGTVSVPDPQHNLYHVQADVTSCGDRDGQYQGLGALFDADAMQDFMAEMYPFEHGGDRMHAHNGHMAGQTVVPSGTENLFMFGMYDDVGHHAIVDALAR